MFAFEQNAGFCWQSLGERISCYDRLFWLSMPGTAAGMLSGKRGYTAGMMGLFISLSQEVCVVLVAALWPIT